MKRSQYEAKFAYRNYLEYRHYYRDKRYDRPDDATGKTASRDAETRGHLLLSALSPDSRVRAFDAPTRYRKTHAANRTGARVALIALLFALNGCGPTAKSPDGDGIAAAQDWAVYNGNAGNTHYSRLDQITPANVERLQVAWDYNAEDAFTHNGAQSDMQTNPLVIDGKLYFVSPKGRVICLDGATGKPIWTFDPADGEEVLTRQRSRGLAYWSDGRRARIIASFRHHLLAIDVETGQLDPRFGLHGRIDLREGLGRDPASITIANVTPAIIYRDLIIVGSTGSTPGHVRAYDARSGRMRWIFHTIPHPGEFGHDSWPANAWKTAKGANVWAGFSLDVETGTLFLPTASAGMGEKDYYGTDRIGDNLFGTSLVALDAATGKRRWHFQMVRHDLWDRDLPSAPALVTVRRDGRDIPAVAQPTKAGLLYIFDRRTGTSLFPLEERRVPASDIPGEVAAEMQVFPLLPAPFARQKVTADTLTDRTPAAAAFARAELARYSNRGDYDPPSERGTILLPGLDGGSQWGGPAYDPETGLLYVNANEMAWILKLKPRPPVLAGRSGHAIYMNQCAACHGEDRHGSPPEFPGLVGIAGRLPSQRIAAQIREGSGRMPGFPNLTDDELTLVTQYLVTGAVGPTDDSPTDAARAGPDGNAWIFDGFRRFLDQDGYPAIAPPWGTLSAIDVSSGAYRWRIPFGEYPELAAGGLRNTGSENYGGGVVTRGGLLFIAATVFDNKFRAFDKLNGRLLWETTLPAAGHATPATYMVGGRQYVVIAAGGGKNPKQPSQARIIAFALPPDR